MRAQHLPLVALFCLLLFAPLSQADDERLLGYTPESASHQKQLEADLIATVDPDAARALLKEVSGRINMAGTPGDRANAEFVRDYLNKLGFEAKIYPYYVYLPYPVKAELTIEGDTPVHIVPGERGVDADPYSKDIPFPPFNAFSPSGKAKAEVVFVNFAREEDFAELEKLGIDVEGKIVIARYGRLFRGSKAWQAEKHGAAALILYSDPADDGYARGDVYPVGPMRPDDGIQRGSIYYMFSSPGDALTPMEPALKDAERLDPAEAGLPKVPTMPISYGDAAKILSRLRGDEVPNGWQGGLPFRYHLGGTADVVVSVDIENEFKVREIWNVAGILKGTEEPDQWVMVGCHRDAWLYGAQDPHGGTASMLEAARAIAESAKKNGGLKRSVVICTWDAEEFGVIGSIEWVEDLRDELRDRAVLYLNCDAMISGQRFRASATPTVRPAYEQVLATVPDVEEGMILANWEETQREAGRPTGHYSFGSMGGGGSDHTGFLHHIGVPCAGGGFGGRSGIYHSAYDTFTWMEQFGDPGFKSHASAARLIGSLMARFANADVLPYRPSEYAPELKQQWERFAKDHEKNLSPEQVKGIQDLLETIEAIGHAYEAEVDGMLAKNSLSEDQKNALNAELLQLERTLTDSRGIAGRPWSRNVFYATNLDNGYGSQMFPGLDAAIKGTGEIGEEYDKLIEALKRYRDATGRMLALLYVNK